jgi:hypothetical protein
MPAYPCFTSVSQLQVDAWAAWNASYHEPSADAYRALGNALYHQTWRECITVQLARLDEQNARLDALLSGAASVPVHVQTRPSPASACSVRST